MVERNRPHYFFFWIKSETECKQKRLSQIMYQKQTKLVIADEQMHKTG